MLRNLLIFSTILSTFTSIQAAEKLRQVKPNPLVMKLVLDCRTAINVVDKTVPETIACPTVQKYTYQNSVNLSVLLSMVESQLGFTLKASSPKNATLLVLDSFMSQANAVNETLSEGSGEYSKSSLEKTKAALNSAIFQTKLMGKMMVDAGSASVARTFVDPSTYWAPSVNAVAAIIVNPVKKTVYVIMHGDLDG